MQGGAAKLGRAFGRCEKLAMGPDQRVEALANELDEFEVVRRKLVEEMSASAVDLGPSTPECAPLCVAGILDDAVGQIPLSFEGLGFDDV